MIVRDAEGLRTFGGAPFEGTPKPRQYVEARSSGNATTTNFINPGNWRTVEINGGFSLSVNGTDVGFSVNSVQYGALLYSGPSRWFVSKWTYNCRAATGTPMIAFCIVKNGHILSWQQMRFHMPSGILSTRTLVATFQLSSGDVISPAVQNVFGSQNILVADTTWSLREV